MCAASQRKPEPTVIGQMLLCAACFGGARFCYARGQIGADVAGLGDVGGVLAIGFLVGMFVTGIRCLHAVDVLADRRRWERDAGSTADAQGDARIGSDQDAKQRGFLGAFGFICGSIGGNLFRIVSEKSMIVTGPPGSGKSLWLLVNLVASRHRIKTKNGYREVKPGLLILDLSGEIYCSVWRWLKSQGYRLVVLCPEADRLSRELGVEFESTPCNPAELLRNSENPKDDAEMLARFLHPGTPKGKSGGSTEHFDEIARIVLATWILWLLYKYGVVRLTDLRTCVSATPDIQAAAVAQMLMIECDGGTPIEIALHECAGTLHTLMSGGSDEYVSAMTTVARAMTLYSISAPAGRQVADNKANWSDLKDSDRPTAFFIITPPERLDTYGPWISLTVAAGVEQLARHRNNFPVHLHLDEIGNIYLPNLMKIISVYRKFGIVTILYLQAMRAQLARWYGNDAASEIISNCETVQSFSTRSLSDLKEFAELAGQETVRNVSATLRESEEGTPNVSFTGQYLGQPVLRVETMRTLSSSKTMVMHGNEPPYILDVVNPLEEKWLRKRLDENPYYRG